MLTDSKTKHRADMLLMNYKQKKEALDHKTIKYKEISKQIQGKNSDLFIQTQGISTVLC